jgi:putative nucleotidyltransferase with HDIG domain
MVISVRELPVEIRKSPIHGKGVFSKEKIKKGDVIGLIMTKDLRKDSRTVVGKYLNHSADPNALAISTKKGYALAARQDIPADTEILVDYQQFEDLSGIPQEIPMSKNASKYVEKKKEESGNITYIYSDKHVEERNKKKAKKLDKLSKNINKVRKQITTDLKSDDSKKKYNALAVGLIDDTYERVGNRYSAQDMKHYGVTTWLKKHIKFTGGTAVIKYVGKSGVKQDKKISNKKLIPALKELTQGKKDNEPIFKGDDYYITDNTVNAYLKPFDITAKDIRGFHANEEMRKELKKVRKGSLPKDQKEKEKKLKEEFKKALENTAKIVGHEAGTLKNQYLIPGLEKDYTTRGKIASDFFALSKRAIENPYEELLEEEEGEGRREQYIREVLEKNFPDFPPNLLAGWDITVAGFSNVLAWLNFPIDIASARIKLRKSSVAGCWGELSWPTELGDFGLNPEIELNRNAYIVFFENLEELKKLFPVIEKIGIFAETMRLHGGKYEMKPEGKAQSGPDLTQLFPIELFDGWAGSHGKTEIRMNYSYRAAFVATARGLQNQILIRYGGPVEVPEELKQFTLGYASDVSARDLSWEEFRSLVPATIEMLKSINKELKKESFSQFPLSKRAQPTEEIVADPLEIFEKFIPNIPIHIFGGWDLKTIYVGGTPVVWAEANFPRLHRAKIWYYPDREFLVINWPIELGQIIPEASMRSGDQYTARYHHRISEKKDEIIYLINTIGSFAESMSLAAEEGRDTSKIEPLNPKKSLYLSPLSKRAALAEEEVQRLLIQILPGTQFAGKAYSVGGYERDKMMGKESKDLDIVVEIKGGAEALAKFIANKFPEQTSAPRQLGAAYPIWHVAFKENITYENEQYATRGAEIDIADTQKEHYPDPSSRQRETVYAPLKDDVERRDFTVNMLLRDLTSGEIKDLTGVSKEDVKRGILRGHPAVNPDVMFSNDPLRMLRLIRFQCKYDWEVPLSMLKSVRRNAEEIQKISWERIQEELNKIMKLGKTASAIRLMKATNLLGYILPEIHGLVGVKHDKRSHQEGDVYKHTLLVLSNAPPTIEGQLAALLHDVGKPDTQEFIGNKIQFLGHEDVGAEMAEAILRRLKFDNKTIQKVKTMVKNHMRPHSLEEASPKALRKFVRDVGEEMVDNVLDLAEADSLGNLPPRNYIPELRKRIEEAKKIPVARKPVLSGHEIMELLNEKPGPIVGQVGNYLLDLQDELAEEGEELTREKAKEMVRKRFASLSKRMI